jgi:hypothetical protein
MVMGEFHSWLRSIAHPRYGDLRLLMAPPPPRSVSPYIGNEIGIGSGVILLSSGICFATRITSIAVTSITAGRRGHTPSSFVSLSFCLSPHTC